SLAAQLKPGQRLVSPEGDLWRWDGFAAASNAPTAAARRLAAKNRLADLDAELSNARGDAEGRRRAVEAAEAELAGAVAAEGDARRGRRQARRDGRGTRRGAGACARGRIARQAPIRDRGRTRRMGHAQDRRRRPDRHAGTALRRGAGRARLARRRARSLRAAA